VKAEAVSYAGPRATTLAFALVLVAACGGGGAGAGDVRYPRRPAGCAVKSFPSDPPVPVDDLGPVAIDCVAGAGGCMRQLYDAVCARGGDVAWGTGENALSATHLVAHAAHTRRVTQGPRERGCAVQVFTEAPPVATENIGPVTALCNQDDSRDACVRELQDQTCLLGGDVVWQIEGPTPQGDKQKMSGRAAHTK
jgi:hypothetical protein